MMNKNWSVAITGSGGSGSVTAGMILLEALALKGLYGVMNRSYGPQIRGGESAVMIRFATEECLSPSDVFDVLLSLDWLKVDRFAEEIPLASHSVIIGDKKAGPVPDVLAASGAQCHLLNFAERAKAIEEGRSNMIALGLLGAWIGLSADQFMLALHKVLGKKSDAVIDAAKEGLLEGMGLKVDGLEPLALADHLSSAKRWILSGNEASGYGAILGGIRFVAAYPITPASDLLEWLAPRLEGVGGTLLQAEDELASINMVIGASFGGVPSLTATSGPGLSLMFEALGLAVASETPVVVINVSRGGPSTGIPTKSEQSDLNIALFGMHGDAPHIVVAPFSIKDCVTTCRWAVELAETLQVPVIVLSDQMIAQARAIIDAPPEKQSPQKRLRAEQKEASDYQRYLDVVDGVSPMSFPGDHGLQYTADGLEHNQKGTPSSLASDHAKQSEKRQRKLLQYDYGNLATQSHGEGDCLLISWGSSSEVCKEAAQKLQAAGLGVTLLSLRLLLPLPELAIRRALEGVRQCIVVELNGSAQLYHYLQSQGLIPSHSLSYCRPGPLFFRPVELIDFIRENTNAN